MRSPTSFLAVNDVRERLVKEGRTIGPETSEFVSGDDAVLVLIEAQRESAQDTVASLERRGYVLAYIGKVEKAG